MISIPDFALFFLIYALFNGLAFSIFASDKIKAGKNMARIPENQLLVLALIGPFGAFAAMLIFRHKTRKLKFYVVPVIALLHGFLIIRLFRYVMH
jgi:uncharacterized membrane protein YsdA (DUF1294 family)